LYELVVHNDAAADLRAIAVKDKQTALVLGRFIGQLKADQDLMDRLTQNKFGGSPARPTPKNASFNVSFWGAAQTVGMNLWRVRPFLKEIHGYRLVYAYLPTENKYVVLAVAEKAEHGVEDDERFDYELGHEISIRITRAYAELTG